MRIAPDLPGRDVLLLLPKDRRELVGDDEVVYLWHRQVEDLAHLLQRQPFRVPHDQHPLLLTERPLIEVPVLVALVYVSLWARGRFFSASASARPTLKEHLS